MIGRAKAARNGALALLVVSFAVLPSFLPGGQAVRVREPTLEELANEVKTAQKNAEEFAAKAQEAADDNLRELTKFGGATTDAQEAVVSARKAAKEIAALLAATEAKVKEAAKKGAMKALAAIKEQAARDAKRAAAAAVKEQIAAEDKAAEAGAAAAEPFHSAMVRAQKAAREYWIKANEYALASNNLAQQSHNLAKTANEYQMWDQTVMANQIIMQAQTMMKSATAMRAESNRLGGAANEMNNAVPAFQMGSLAAAAAASEAAMPVADPEAHVVLPY